MILTVVLGALAVAGAVAVAVLVRREQVLTRRVGRATSRLGGRVTAASAAEQLDALDESVEAVSRRLDEMIVTARLVRALDTIPQGVVICDERGAAVFENQVGAGFSGARHGDALVSAAVDELLSAAVEGSAASRTLELYGPPRRTLAIDAYPLPGPAGTGVSGALAVIEDVTERRRLEHVRRDFVANISHELKTPVGALALLAETLLSADDPVDRERLARRMLDEAHRVGHTIDDLLSLSRIEADESTEWMPVRLSEVVHEASARAASAAEQRGILIVTPSADGLAVRGDARQLVSALFNLLDNAVKYSDSGSTVSVAVRREGNWVELSVADHGPGIPARDLERIFERFYRVDRARSRETGGTGLGLAIVRHVATNHGGVVTVESREGEGSRFTLRIPGLPTGPADAVVPQGHGSAVERSVV